MARWRRRVWPKAARLFQKDFKIITAPGVSESLERAHQLRRRFDDRKIRRVRAENEGLRCVGEKTDRREESSINFGHLRSNNLEIGTQRQAGDACDRFRCKHRAIAGLREDSCHPEGTRTISGSDTVDRKSTRLNSSHSQISYAVFCLK